MQSQLLLISQTNFEDNFILFSCFYSGLPVNTSTAAAPQPVGFAAGVRAAEERICGLRSAHNIPVEQTVLAVENFLVEIGENK